MDISIDGLGRYRVFLISETISPITSTLNRQTNRDGLPPATADMVEQIFDLPGVARVIVHPEKLTVWTGSSNDWEDNSLEAKIVRIISDNLDALPGSTRTFPGGGSRPPSGGLRLPGRRPDQVLPKRRR